MSAAPKLDTVEVYTLSRFEHVETKLADQAAHQKHKRNACLVEADKRLDQWSKWAKENRQALGYPTISSLFRVMMDSRRAEEKKDSKAVLDDKEEKRKTEQKRKEGKLFMIWGKETRSFREDNHFIPEIIAEVDRIVARLPRSLEQVVTAYYFTYGVIEVKAKAANLKKAQFCRLLEAAKYSVWTALNTIEE